MARQADGETRSEDIAEVGRPDAFALHEVIRRDGNAELGRHGMALLCSAIAAGRTMGFSLIVPGVLTAHLPDAPWTELLTGMGYATGFLIMVLGRQQLFTENTVTPILPLLHVRTPMTLARVLRLWGIVLAGNVAGTAAIAAVLAIRTPSRQTFASLLPRSATTRSDCPSLPHRSRPSSPDGSSD